MRSLFWWQQRNHSSENGVCHRLCLKRAKKQERCRKMSVLINTGRIINDAHFNVGTAMRCVANILPARKIVTAFINHFKKRWLNAWKWMGKAKRVGSFRSTEMWGIERRDNGYFWFCGEEIDVIVFHTTPFTPSTSFTPSTPFTQLKGRPDKWWTIFSSSILLCFTSLRKVSFSFIVLEWDRRRAHGKRTQQINFSKWLLPWNDTDAPTDWHRTSAFK